MLKRANHLKTLHTLLRQNPAVGLLGPRQIGKTTLADQLASLWPTQVHRFDLEDERDLERLSSPMQALEGLRGLVILDEVQHRKELFKTLRVLCDRNPLPARFLVLGSASPELLKQSSESLAGRISYFELPGISLTETRQNDWNPLWLRGGFPRSLLALNEKASLDWRRNLVRTFLERDLPGLDVRFPAETMRRFWTMLAHAHGQIWNSSEFSRSFGVSDKTIRNYLGVLSDTYMVRLLQPFYENLGKRQVRSPKVYFRDSGLFHLLAGILDRKQLETHPRCGASWEGFALEQVIQISGAWNEQCYFWATHQGAELDLLIVRGSQRTGFEFKFSPTPGYTPSMKHAMSDLKLNRLWVIHPGKKRYPLGDKAEAIPLTQLPKVLN